MNAFTFSKIVKGKMLEVGLGDGVIAQSVLKNKNVLSLTSYERDKQKSKKFKSNGKHKIIDKDFTKENKIEKYDVVIVDAVNDLTKEDYDNVKAIVTKLKSLPKGTKIIMEYFRDTDYERDLRAFMKSHFGDMKTEFINTGNKSNSRFIGYYEV